MERYPRRQKLQRMLEELDRTITEAERRQGDPEVRVMIPRSGEEAGVHLSYFDAETYDTENLNLGEELGFSSGETIGLFRWAESDGYIRPRYGSGTGRDSQMPVGVLDHLESQGYELIGELPDPAKLLMLRLDAVQEAINARSDLPPEQKESATRALGELKHFLRGLPPGIVVEVASTFFRGMIGG